MKISEIFYSIQGEGVNAGSPAVFVRTSKCNLQCVYCDSPYTWNNGTEMDVEEVKDKILEYDCDHVVITGGEPLLQQHSVRDLLMRLPHYVEIETNGTIIPDSVAIVQLADLITVSPKLSNSGMKDRVNKEAINYFGEYINTVFKFPVGGEEDLQEVDNFIDKYSIPIRKVILMPVTRKGEGYNIRDDLWIVKHCMDKDYRYSPRLQISLWGYERGR